MKRYPHQHLLRNQKLPVIKEPQNDAIRLSTDLDAYYAEAYFSIASSGSFGLASRLQHRQLERHSLVRELSGQRILEVGAGGGQHIAFVDPDSWTEYLQTDLRPPAEVYSGEGSWISESVDASSLPFPDQTLTD